MKNITVLSILMFKLTDKIIYAGNRGSLFCPNYCVLMSLLEFKIIIFNMQ